MGQLSGMTVVLDEAAKLSNVSVDMEKVASGASAACGHVNAKIYA